MLQDKLHVFCFPFFPNLKAQGIRNPANDWNLESKFHGEENRYPVPGIRNPQHATQNQRLFWITFNTYMDGAKDIKLIKSLYTNFLFNCPTSVSAVATVAGVREKGKGIHASYSSAYEVGVVRFNIGVPSSQWSNGRGSFYAVLMDSLWIPSK